MSEPFDPYYTWLGIPPEEQPPHHYRLLGLRPLEDNADVIQHAADRQMAHLRSFQAGKHGPLSQKVLNEVAAARICLLNANRKAAYDAELGKRLAPPAAEPAAERAKGSVFAEYLLEDLLADSRTGKVFKARHRTMGRVVALKVLNRETTGSAEMVERFRRKIKILAQLTHPNLVAAYEAGQREGTHFLVMEYVDGQDLLSLVKKQGPLAVDKAVDYAAQAAAGLGHMHAQGVYHRNVKPSNLMVDKQGLVKVVGVGLAHVEPGTALAGGAGELTQAGQVMGTRDFMSPEQAADSSSVDHRADVYSLGCTLYALLTGRSPYPGKSAMQQTVAHLQHPIPSLRALRSDEPEALDRAFQKMLAKKADDRFQSMDEVIAALRAGVGEG